METIGAYEAKTHLARLLEEVGRGRSITITKHGRPVARLCPAEPERADPGDTIAALRAERVSLNGINVSDLNEEGRRSWSSYWTPGSRWPGALQMREHRRPKLCCSSWSS